MWFVFYVVFKFKNKFYKQKQRRVSHSEYFRYLRLKMLNFMKLETKELSRYQIFGLYD